MKRLGPELKMPKLKSSSFKAPPVLADVYQDLRDRRLLPLVVLVVVAILAVPFLIGESHEPVSESGLESVGSTGGQPAGDASLTVVKSTPGLRDYRKRLKARTPTDPFVQKYTGVPPTSQLKSVESAGGTADGGSSSGLPEVPSESAGGGSSVGSTTPSDEGSPAGGGRGSTDSGEAGGGPSAKLDDDDRLFGFRPDVRFGIAGSQQLSFHKELPLGSFLPSGDPVVVFIGVPQSGKVALFDVARDLSSVEGDGQCVGGKKNCGILALREGEAVSLLTRPGARPYRLAVDKIDFVEVDVPAEARSSAAMAPRAAGLP